MLPGSRHSVMENLYRFKPEKVSKFRKENGFADHAWSFGGTVRPYAFGCESFLLEEHVHMAIALADAVGGSMPNCSKSSFDSMAFV